MLVTHGGTREGGTGTRVVAAATFVCLQKQPCLQVSGSGGRVMGTDRVGLGLHPGVGKQLVGREGLARVKQQ